jgi:hypothetical protein
LSAPAAPDGRSGASINALEANADEWAAGFSQIDVADRDIQNCEKVPDYLRKVLLHD